MNKKLSRRIFISSTGALFFGIVLPVKGKVQKNLLKVTLNQSRLKNEVEHYQNAFIQIDANNNITFLLPNIEIGQGISTAASMILAEELDVDINQVSIKISPIEIEHQKNFNNDFYITYGSGSIAKDWKPLRQAAAVLRMMFIKAAAEIFNINIDQCHTQQGQVIGFDN